MLEDVIDHDRDGITDMVMTGIRSRSIFNIEHNKADVVEADRLIDAYLRREPLGDTAPEAYIKLFEAVSYGRNVGRIIMSLSPMFRDLRHIPDLSIIPGEITSMDMGSLSLWVADQGTVGDLIKQGADSIVSSPQRLQLASAHMIALVLMHTEAQARRGV